MNPSRWLLACAMGLITATGTTAQVPGPAFEVASVRPSASQAGPRYSYTGQTFTFTNATLRNLIRLAYGIGPLEVKAFATTEGEPRWSATDMFDIVARTSGREPALTSAQLGPLNQMLQALLTERFKLVARWGKKEAQVYALTLASRDGRLGPQLKRSTVDCDAYRAERQAKSAAGMLKTPALGDAREHPVCGTAAGPLIKDRASVPGTREILIGTQPLEALADALGMSLQAPVEDRTGLVGNFDIALRYSPPTRPDSTGTAPDPGPGWATLENALRDQLGLKLERTKGTIDVLVIDSVQQPTVN